ncbi:MAG: helix-turn-helix transcriptional regulator [Clostridia bacterium]|nr:helix-turn-helix transcriptional regulator [Clostridia bacterium]
MHYFSYNENKQHGTLNFPVAYYLVDSKRSPYVMPLHWHKEWELIYVTGGSVGFIINGEHITAKAGEVLLMGGGTLHSASADECSYQCLNFGLHELVLNVLSVREAFRLFYRNVYIPRTLYTSKDSEICSIVREIFAAFSPDCSESFCRMSTLGNITRLFAYILENKYYTENSDSPSGTFEKINMLKQVLEYIETHFSEEIKLSTLAEIVGMNENYFCRFFHSHTRQTPINYLSLYRIEQAANMLFGSNMSVTEIAFRCGFNDVGYFIKCFKKIKGCTPKQFRLLAS